MTIDIEEIKWLISPILDEYGVRRAAVLGGIFQEEARRGSDFDLLVEVRNPYEPLKFSDLHIKLEKATNKKINLMKKNEIYSTLKPIMLREAIYIFHR